MCSQAVVARGSNMMLSSIRGQCLVYSPGMRLNTVVVSGPGGIQYGMSASVIFPCSIESRRLQALVEEVGKGCSEFCIVGILIHSRLEALAVHLSRPSG